MTDFGYGIQPRPKGRRYAARVIPTFAFERDRDGKLYQHGQAEPCGTIESMGTFEGTDGFGLPATYEALRVTLTSGIVVAAYRRGPEFTVCQDYTYLLGRTSEAVDVPEARPYQFGPHTL